MTTTVKIHVGGKYRAHVAVSHADGSAEEHTVDGDGVAGSMGLQTITLRHPADAIINISEAPIEE